MSNIQVLPRAAGQTAKVARVDMRSQRNDTADKAEASDHDMMYAWSIGVTTAARPRVQESERLETCPPETYIG